MNDRYILTALLTFACCHGTCAGGFITARHSARPWLPPSTAVFRSRTASTSILTSSPAPTFDTVEDDEAMRTKYLRRIGIDADRINDLIERDYNQITTETRRLALDDLQCLLTAHLFTVPFENLDQHSHPPTKYAASTDEMKNAEERIIPRRSADELPSLDVRRSLHKICHKNRGGFCYELNLSFAWLLRSLGFEGVRLAAADVGCSQSTRPAHVVVIVDGIGPGSSPVLVDVGFGTPGVCDVVLPLVHDELALDTHGDSFRFVPCFETDRFDRILYRRRITESGKEDEEEPMYRFHSRDDLPYDAEEFACGLDHVLNNSPTFTGKRLCVLSTERGHCTLGEGYVKWVERGKAVKTIQLVSETEWREALSQYFGIVL